jgi:crotonobetainyl-CoA:carnitine CoA-transferase CaiB-like acyl-CoA transferase
VACHVRGDGRPDLADDPRFSAVAARAQRVQEIIKIVQDWVDAATTKRCRKRWRNIVYRSRRF